VKALPDASIACWFFRPGSIETESKRAFADKAQKSSGNLDIKKRPGKFPGRFL
jgi:hypothetical protein